MIVVATKRRVHLLPEDSPLPLCGRPLKDARQVLPMDKALSLRACAKCDQKMKRGAVDWQRAKKRRS